MFGLLWPIHMNMWLQYLRDSMHALNVSFCIMWAILFRHLIGVNCRLYMTPYCISQVSGVLIYPVVIGKNIVLMIRQDLTTFAKPVMYREQSTLWIILCKARYQIHKSRFFYEKEDLRFNTIVIIIIFYLKRNETLLYNWLPTSLFTLLDSWLSVNLLIDSMMLVVMRILILWGYSN